MPGQQQNITFGAVVNRAITLLFYDEKPNNQSNGWNPNQQMTNTSVVCENERRLSLVFEDLCEFPFSLVKKYSAWVQMVDISHNRFSDVKFLEHFDVLDAVILDHNLVSSETIFPRLPSLKTLWLNHNHIEDMVFFLEHLSSRCPNLVFLSLMGNEATPSALSGAPQLVIDRYRLFVISLFPKLRYLDDRPVAMAERDAAQQLRETRRTSVTQVLDSINVYIESKLMRRKSSRTPVSGFV